MFSLIKSIQSIIANNKHQKLKNLKYKDLLIYGRPTELEKVLPFNYFVIETPAANDSQETKKDLEKTIDANSTRNPKTDITVLAIDEDPKIMHVSFAKNKKIVFDNHKFEVMYNVLYDILKDLKYYFNRPRPNQIAEFYGTNLNVLNTKTHHTPSYPSGHVAYAALAEMIIAEEYPEYTDELQELTNKVSFARMKQGVHFESDNIASIQLVRTIYNDLKNYVYNQESTPPS